MQVFRACRFRISGLWALHLLWQTEPVVDYLGFGFDIIEEICKDLGCARVGVMWGERFLLLAQMGQCGVWGWGCMGLCGSKSCCMRAFSPFDECPFDGHVSDPKVKTCPEPKA